jgi:hypothetical protein
MPWAFDPHSGGVAIPRAIQDRTRQRILAHAQKRHRAGRDQELPEQLLTRRDAGVAALGDLLVVVHEADRRVAERHAERRQRP